MAKSVTTVKSEPVIASAPIQTVTPKPPVKGMIRHVSDPKAGINWHSVFRRNPETKEITAYATYRPQTNPQNPNPMKLVLRYDGPKSDSHYNKVLDREVFSPHIHDKTAPGVIREAHPWEIPKIKRY